MYADAVCFLRNRGMNVDRFSFQILLFPQPKSHRYCGAGLDYTGGRGYYATIVDLERFLCSEF
jgi:hypothetical protein